MAKRDAAQLPPEVRFRLAVCTSSGVLGLCFAAAIVLSSISTPAGEPFWSWADYFRAAFVGSFWCMIPLAAILSLVLAGVPDRQDYRIRAAGASLGSIWLMMPIVLAWCACWLMNASHNTNFSFATSAKLPAWTGRPLELVSHPFWLLVMPVGFLLLCRLSYRKTAKMLLGYEQGLCGSCGYDVRSISVSVCPECGAPLAQRDAL